MNVLFAYLIQHQSRSKYLASDTWSKRIAPAAAVFVVVGVKPPEQCFLELFKHK